MIKQSIHTLLEVKSLLSTLQNNEHYIASIAILDNATIGQHTRHIIEMYECMLIGYQTGICNYENRKRNYEIESNINYANNCLNALIEQIDKTDKTIAIEYMCDENTVIINSSYNRELLYNLEHCIHHQALIKVALNVMNLNVVSTNFGVAPSTLKYRLQCAQ